jgi:hypothetical protein
LVLGGQYLDALTGHAQRFEHRPEFVAFTGGEGRRPGAQRDDQLIDGPLPLPGRRGSGDPPQSARSDPVGVVAG